LKKIISHNAIVELLKLEFGDGADIPYKLHSIVVTEDNQYRLLFYAIKWWVVGNFNVYVDIIVTPTWVKGIYGEEILKNITSIILKLGKFPPDSVIMVASLGEKWKDSMLRKKILSSRIYTDLLKNLFDNKIQTLMVGGNPVFNRCKLVSFGVYWRLVKDDLYLKIITVNSYDKRFEVVLFDSLKSSIKNIGRLKNKINIIHERECEKI